MKKTTWAHRVPLFQGILVGLFYVVLPLGAQEQVPEQNPESILEQLGDPERRWSGLSALSTFLGTQPPMTEVDRLVEGLIQLTSRDEVLVRRAAISGLLLWAKSDVDVRGTNRGLQALERAYDSPALGVEKGVILLNMHELEAGLPALQFMRRVALDDHPGWEGLPTLAIEGMARMGEPGRAILRDLHEQRRMPEGQARRRLEDLAANNFRLGGG